MTTSAAFGRWERIRTHLRANWLTYASVLLIALVVFGVPQVLHLFELGTPSGEANAFYAYSAAVILIYFATGWWIVPPQVRFPIRRRARTPEAAQDSANSLRHHMWRQVERHRWTTMVVSYFIGVPLIVAAIVGNTEGAERLDPSIALTFGVFFVLVAVVMTAWPRFDERTRRLLVRVLVSLMALNAIGEMIWWLAGMEGSVSYRYYSLWAILHTLFCMVLFARVVDYWQGYSPVPIRAIAVALAMFTFASLGPRPVGEWRPESSIHGATATPDHGATGGDDPLQALPGVDLPVADSWLAHLKMRLDAMPEDGPVVLVAASGGGSRAALFTALVYEDLRRTPVPRDGAADYRIDDHVLLISSVSGGSLASACYVDDEYRQQIDGRKPDHRPRNFFADETVSLMQEILPSIEGRPWYEGVRADGQPVQWWRAAQDCCGDEQARWFFHRKFIDDMCTDFMAPLLRGLLYPLQDRGQSTMRFWQRRFGLSATNLDWQRRVATKLAEIDASKTGMRPKLADWPPLLLCNATEVERGTRSIIGFPPLPWDLLSHEVEGKHAPREWIALASDEGPPTRVCEVSLAEAVRLSAGFPWGFPVARIEIPRNEIPQSGQQEIAERDVRFVDGAVVDNTGIDSLRYVIDRLKSWAALAENRGAAHAERRYVVAKEIVDELMNRGIVILEIDSGAKPEPPGRIAQALSGLFEPIAALSNAAYARAASTAGIHIGLIESQLPFRRARQLRWRIERLTRPIWQETANAEGRQQAFPNVKRITVICNHEDNVMTAWALGPRDKANVFLRFAAGSAKMHDEWADYLNQYEFDRLSVDVLDKRLTSFEEKRKQGDSIPAADLEEVRQGYEFLVQRSQIERTMHDLERTIEAQLAQGIAPSAAQLEQVAAKIDVELGKQPDFAIPLPRVDGEPAESRPPAFEKRIPNDFERPPRQPTSKTEKLQTDYSRVGAQIKQLQQKVTERNNEGIRSIQQLQRK
jgi:hypothetical protein